MTGAGSLVMLHLHERPIVDYRSAYRRPDEKALVYRGGETIEWRVVEN